MSQYHDTEFVPKPRVGVEQASSVAIYYRLQRVVLEWQDGVTCTWRNLPPEELVMTGRICSAAGYRLRAGSGCGDRWEPGP
jgi:hypothetical protein